MFSNLKYRRKILVLLGPVFVFLAAGLFVIYAISRNSLITEHRVRLEHTVSLTSDRIKHKEEEMMKLVNLFQANRPLIEYLYIMTVMGEDKKPLTDMLSPMYVALNVNSLILYDAKGNGVLELDTKPGHPMTEIMTHKIQSLPSGIVSGYTETYNTAKITGMGPLSYMGKTVGYISVGTYIDGEYLNELKNISGNEFMLVKGEKISASTLGETAAAYKPKNGRVVIDLKEYSVMEQEIKDPGGKQIAKVVTALSDKDLHEALHRLRLSIFGILGLAGLISAGLSILFIKALVKPLDDMVALTGRIAEGDFSGELTVKGKDEIAVLSGHFVDMQRKLMIQRRKIEHYTEDLERAVEARTNEVERMQAQLIQAQKMESLGTLASGIAHDFNNILTAILGYASFVKEEIDENHPHFRYWDIVEQASLRGTELTSNLMTFSGGRIDLEKKKPVSIKRLIEEVVGLLGRTFPKSISFETAFAEGDANVLGDGGALYQALINICINARDAMPQGGRLRIETGKAVMPEDSRTDRPKENAVLITVSDTGQGMKKEVLDRVFEPFFTTKAHGKGTGLGLAMVYGIIHKHQGVIHISSEEGMGTTFSIYLPATDRRHEEEEDSGTAPAALKQGMTILVIDDEEQLRKLCSEILEKAGYRVITAPDGNSGVEIYREKQSEISLVILDMIMPGISGHETFRLLKSVNSSVKVVISSGFSPDMGINWAEEEGVMGFIRKPYRSKDMIGKINEIVS